VIADPKKFRATHTDMCKEAKRLDEELLAEEAKAYAAEEDAKFEKMLEEEAAKAKKKEGTQVFEDLKKPLVFKNTDAKKQSIGIREGPDTNSKRIERANSIKKWKVIQFGTTFKVSEVRHVGGQIYLKLADESGWAFTNSPTDGRLLAEPFEATYIVGEQNTNHCPPGSDQIVIKPECVQAAIVLGRYFEHSNATSLGSCSSLGHRVFWDSRTSDSASVVCKKTPATLKAALDILQNDYRPQDSEIAVAKRTDTIRSYTTHPYTRQTPVALVRKSCCNKGRAQCCQMVRRGGTCSGTCADCRDVAKLHLEKFDFDYYTKKLVLNFTGWNQSTPQGIILDDIMQAVNSMGREFRASLVPDGPYTKDTRASEGYWELEEQSVRIGYAYWGPTTKDMLEKLEKIKTEFNNRPRRPDVLGMHIKCSKASNPLLSFYEKALLEYCDASKRSKNKVDAEVAISQENARRFRQAGTDAA